MSFSREKEPRPPHMTPIEIAREIFPNNLPSPEELEKKYPPRKLPKNAEVTRVGPSPTGQMHIGTLYVGLLSERIAHQTGGRFFLRVEDTDTKREVPGATEYIIKSFDQFGIPFDEGKNANGSDRGSYGPYTQSERQKIYHAYIKKLLEQGGAYVCFATPEELDSLRATQAAEGVLRTGYYGKWALWRDKSPEEVMATLRSKKSYVIRFKSNGSHDRKIKINDLVYGQREFAENDQDIVLMKSDGLPTYHLAHVIDDHLMRTTLVVRGDEWLPSVPTHLQLFEAFGFEPPKYAHVAPLNKLEEKDGKISKRKLSKRKDPEAGVRYFVEHGYPAEAVKEYLLYLANAEFENWRKDNPNTDFTKFELTFKGLQGSSGPLFDFAKLNDISKEKIASFSAEEVYVRTLDWAQQYDKSFAKLLMKDPAYAKSIFAIERGDAQARKDISTWADIPKEFEYFFDERFKNKLGDIETQLKDISKQDLESVVRDFLTTYTPTDTKDEWFAKLKRVGGAHGFAENTKEYKKNPDAFKGNMADVAKIFRVLLTGRTQTPDLYSIMQTMGPDRVAKRLSIILQL